MPNSAWQYASHEPWPSGTQTRGVRVADSGGEHRHGAPDVVHRLAQPGRHLAGAVLAERRPRRFDDVVLVVVLVAGAHGSIVLRADGVGTRGVRGRSVGLEDLVA